MLLTPCRKALFVAGFAFPNRLLGDSVLHRIKYPLFGKPPILVEAGIPQVLIYLRLRHPGAQHFHLCGRAKQGLRGAYAIFRRIPTISLNHFVNHGVAQELIQCPLRYIFGRVGTLRRRNQNGFSCKFLELSAILVFLFSSVDGFNGIHIFFCHIGRGEERLNKGTIPFQIVPRIKIVQEVVCKIDRVRLTVARLLWNDCSVFCPVSIDCISTQSIDPFQCVLWVADIYLDWSLYVGIYSGCLSIPPLLNHQLGGNGRSGCLLNQPQLIRDCPLVQPVVKLEVYSQRTNVVIEIPAETLGQLCVGVQLLEPCTRIRHTIFDILLANMRLHDGIIVFCCRECLDLRQRLALVFIQSFLGIAHQLQFLELKLGVGLNLFGLFHTGGFPLLQLFVGSSKSVTFLALHIGNAGLLKALKAPNCLFNIRLGEVGFQRGQIVHLAKGAFQLPELAMVNHIPGIGGQQRSQVQGIVPPERLVVHRLGVHDGEGVGGSFLLNNDDTISLLIGNGLIRVLCRFLIRSIRVPYFIGIVLLKACSALIFKAEAFHDILMIRHGKLLLGNVVVHISQHDGEVVVYTSGIVLKLRLQISFALPPARLIHIMFGAKIRGANLRYIVAVHGIDIEILIHGVGNQMELFLCGKQGTADRIRLKRRHHRLVFFAYNQEAPIHVGQIACNIGNHVGRTVNPQEVFLQLGSREGGIGDGVQIVVNLLEIPQPLHHQLTAPFGKLLLYRLRPRRKAAISEIVTELYNKVIFLLLIPLAVRVKQPANLLVALFQGAVVGHIPGVGVFGHIQHAVNAFEMR